MEYSRYLQLAPLLKKKSLFLFGPRSSGKTFLYRKTLEPNRVYNLLETSTLKRLIQRPDLVFEECLNRGEVIIIDEVQKIPEILNEVHRTIEEKGARFLLTGSSARKLKRSQANLLGGRASRLELFPLCSHEVSDFDLLKYLNHGGIPRHYLADREDLATEFDDYVSLYLKEEVKDEAVTRRLEDFSRFLEVMALHSGDELAIENFASDCQIKASTFRNYLEVLKDTLIGFEVSPYLATRKRKAITRSKFFLFDVGITGFLSHRFPLVEKSELFGKAFEHFIAMELRAYLSYTKTREPLCYWRSTSQFEVDFVVGNRLAIEVKAKPMAQDRDLRGLKALGEEKKVQRLLLVSLDPNPRTIDNVKILPWRVFLKMLWNGDFF